MFVIVKSDNLSAASKADKICFIYILYIVQGATLNIIKLLCKIMKYNLPVVLWYCRWNNTLNYILTRAINLE